MEVEEGAVEEVSFALSISCRSPYRYRPTGTGAPIRDLASI